MAINWWFLPELSSLEKGVLELKDSATESSKKEAYENILKKIGDTREIDLKSKGILDLQEIMKELRTLYNKVRFG